MLLTWLCQIGYFAAQGFGPLPPPFEGFFPTGISWKPIETVTSSKPFLATRLTSCLHDPVSSLSDANA